MCYIEITHNPTLTTNESFVLSEQPYEVYYSSYSPTKTNWHDCWVVFKTKVKNRFHLLVSEDRENPIDLNERVYQEDEVSISRNATFCQLKFYYASIRIE